MKSGAEWIEIGVIKGAGDVVTELKLQMDAQVVWVSNWACVFLRAAVP